MQKKGVNISLKGYDDIFSTEQSRAEEQQERVQEIPLSELHPFEGHPFKVVDDEAMMKTAESVRDFGVMTPAIVRPDPNGGYEIISGHRRHRASELAGKETMPVIVRNLDDDAAIILMVDANLQRETILPSERAFVSNFICKLLSISIAEYNAEMKKYHKDILLAAAEYRKIVQDTVDAVKGSIAADLDKYTTVESLRNYALNEIERRDNATALDYLKHIDDFRYYRDQD